MSARLHTSQSNSSAQLAPPRFRAACFEDYDGIARLWEAQSWVIEPFEEWRSIWVDNPVWPRVEKTWPIGWVLEGSSGEIVATLTNIPSLYVFRGEELIAGNSRAWTATSAYRGYALWVIEEYYGQTGADLCVSTSAGAMAVEMIERVATRVPLGDWKSGSYWQLCYAARLRNRFRNHHIPLAAALARPAAGILSLIDNFRAKSLPTLAPGFSVESCDVFDDRFNHFWKELVKQNADKLLADRYAQTLHWHYARPAKMGRLRIFTVSKAGQLRAFSVLIKSRGGQTIFLIDYQTIEQDADLLGGLLRAILQRCEAEGIHNLECLGAGVPKMRIIDDCAPYRRELPSWRFFYHSENPELHAALRDASVWDPSAYDGDISLT
jgi:hypothetical protein